MKNHSNDDIDFGEDSGAAPPDDPAFDAWISRTAPSLNAPRDVPRGEMWAEIHAANQVHLDARAGRITGVTPLRRNHWRLASVIAAALLLGVALDRVALRQTDDSRTSTVAESPVAQTESRDPARVYRMAAAQTLTQAEALLTAYRAGGVPARESAAAGQLGRWGRYVLGSTRLLIDSPAGADPQLRALLEDLELVLVQIVQLSGKPIDSTDRALIDRALQDRDLLPRIRTAVPAGDPVEVGAISDE